MHTTAPTAYRLATLRTLAARYRAQAQAQGPGSLAALLLHLTNAKIAAI